MESTGYGRRRVAHTFLYAVLTRHWLLTLETTLLKIQLKYPIFFPWYWPQPAKLFSTSIKLNCHCVPISMVPCFILAFSSQVLF
jgi:hypothetical protein